MVATPFTSKTSASNANISLSNFTNDPDIKRDTEFLQEFQQVMADSNTSKLLTPYISQFQPTYQKARLSIKKRTKTEASTNPQKLSEQDNIEVSVKDPLKDTKPTVKLAANETMLGKKN